MDSRMRMTALPSVEVLSPELREAGGARQTGDGAAREYDGDDECSMTKANASGSMRVHLPGQPQPPRHEWHSLPDLEGIDEAADRRGDA